VLEIQHIQGDTGVVKTEEKNAGYACTVITDDTEILTDKDLSIIPQYNNIANEAN